MNRKKTYEICMHLIPSLGDEVAVEEFNEVEKAVSSLGEITQKHEPAMVELAYVIRHNVRKSDGSYERYSEAYFCSMKFQAEADKIPGLRDQLQDNESILRFILLETVAEDMRSPVLSEEEEAPPEEGTQEGTREKAGEEPSPQGEAQEKAGEEPSPQGEAKEGEREESASQGEAQEEESVQQEESAQKAATDVTLEKSEETR